MTNVGLKTEIQLHGSNFLRHKFEQIFFLFTFVTETTCHQTCQCTPQKNYIYKRCPLQVECTIKRTSVRINEVISKIRETEL